MLRSRVLSSILLYSSAILVLFVFSLHFFTPSLTDFVDADGRSTNQRNGRFRFFPSGWMRNKESTTVFIPARPKEEVTMPSIPCRETLVTIEQFRSRSVTRAVIVRFPSTKSEYYFVQFRWFYRSWIESEMFTLERWRTDLILLIDDQFPKETLDSLGKLNCTFKNQRQTRRQTSSCVLIQHRTFEQRDKSIRQFYFQTFPALNRSVQIDPNVDRLFAIYDFLHQFNQSQTKIYNYIMVTTLNTFLTTQFGKYIPVKCAFLLGTSPDFSTWFGKSEQIFQFLQILLSTLSEPETNGDNLIIDFELTVNKLGKTFLFLENQVDVSSDSTKTTYRTSIYHLKCYAHSTSLFSERMFRENNYDGYEKQPFNIYIAREYATLMALQSKVMSLEDLRALATNVTSRTTN